MRFCQNTNSSKLCGFSIVELLAAVAIVGVIATLALPRYRAQVARSRQAEAKSNLGTIHKLQKIYATESEMDYSPPRTPIRHAGLNYGIDKCGETLSERLNSLGFRLTDCSKSRYRYVTDGGNDCAQSDGTLDQGKVYPGCTANDIWHMSDIGKLTHTHDVLKSCPGGSSPSSCTAVALPTTPSTPTAPTTPTTPTVSDPPPPPCPTPACSLGGNWVNGTHPNCCVCSLTTCPTGKTLNTSTCSCDCPVATVNACNTSGGTLEADCSCTPPGDTDDDPDEQCCDVYGAIVTKLPDGSNCDASRSIDPVTSTCKQEETCDDITQCCDGNESKTKPAGLTCDDWKGTWSSGANDKGCCKCDSGKRFSFDTSTDPDTGACCRSGLFFTGGVCATPCESGCCSPHSDCCKPGNHKLRCEAGKYLSGKGYEHLNQCGCEECDEEYACKQYITRYGDATWTGTTCKHDDSNYLWKYVDGRCNGSWGRKCDTANKCCTGPTTSVQCNKGSPAYERWDGRFGDANAIPPECGCIKCDEEYACKQYITRYGDATWTGTTCKHDDSNYLWKYVDGRCNGSWGRKCDTANKCCTGPTTSVQCNKGSPAYERWDGRFGDANAIPPECGCIKCDEEYACKQYITRYGDATWTGTTCKHDDSNYLWEYVDGRCDGSWVKHCAAPCQRSSQCCINDGYEIEKPADAGLSLSCDNWHGQWNAGSNDRGCCICSGGKTFSYHARSNSGGCCTIGQSWNGISCESP